MQHKIIVFVKNKLITLDTVMPILIEMKDKYNISSEIVVFDNLAHEAISKNIVLKDAIDYVGSELFITKGEKNKPLRLMYILISLSRIFFSLICGAKIIHFGLFNLWPFKILAYMFSNVVYQLQSTAYDFDYSIISIKNKGIKTPLSVGKNIVIFGLKNAKYYPSVFLKEKKIFFFGETRTRPHWVEYIRSRSDHYFELYHGDIDCSRGVIVFVLATIDALESKRILFESTIQIMKDKSIDIPILIKPHSYTEMKTVHNAIATHKNMRITYLHPSVLSTRSKAFISNNFSNTLADAYSFGVTTVEYSNGGVDNLIKPQYVDYLINNDAEEFSNVLDKALKSTYCPSKFCGTLGADDELLMSLADR